MDATGCREVNIFNHEKPANNLASERDPKQQTVIVRLDLTFLGRYSPFHENNQNGSGGGGNDELVEATTRGGSIEAMACP